MKTKAPETVHESPPLVFQDLKDLDLSILLIGDPGAGKTNFIGTCPQDIWIADFDKGHQTILGQPGVSPQVFKDAPIGGRVMEKHGIYTYGTAWEAFQKSLNVIGETIESDSNRFRTIAIDSFTTMQSCMVAHILANSKHPRGPIEIQDYGTLLNMQKSFFDQLTSWPGLKVVTAHVERGKNELNESIEMLPLGLGKFTSLMPMYFDEIYYLEVKKGETKDAPARRVLTTQPTQYIKQARTRRRVPTDLPATFESLLPYLVPHVTSAP